LVNLFRSRSKPSTAAEAPSAAVDARSKVSEPKGLMAQQRAAMDEIDLLLRSE
jgi:hypothetical protein